MAKFKNSERMDAGEDVENMNHSHVPGTDGNGAAPLGS